MSIPLFFSPESAENKDAGGEKERFMANFGERLESLLESRNISGRDLARRIGVTTGTISGWRNGAYPSADKAVKIAEVFNTSVEYLITGSERDRKGTFTVPLLDQELSAGHGDFLPDDDIIKGFVRIPESLMRAYGTKLAALTVRGDSMEPTLHNGDIVVSTSMGWDSSEGIYSIRLNGMGYVKRLQMGDGKILVKSDNPAYGTIEVPFESENFEVIGKIVFFGILKR